MTNVIVRDEYMIGLVSRPSGRLILYLQKTDGQKMPSVEISIHEGHRVKGAVVNIDGNVFLARQAGLGGSKKRISSDEFRQQVKGFLIENINNRSYVIIDRLGSIDLMDSLVLFARECDRLRSHLRPITAGAADRQRDDRGASVGGIRSGATWEPRHGPHLDAVVRALDEIGCQEEARIYWRADIVRRHPSGKIIIVEVKPTSGLNDLITAIGQSLVYRSDISNCLSILAIPRISDANDKILRLLPSLNIYVVETEKEIVPQIVRAVHQHSDSAN